MEEFFPKKESSSKSKYYSEFLLNNGRFISKIIVPNLRITNDDAKEDD